MKMGKRPLLAVLLLRLFFRGEAHETILGDIEEEFRKNILPRYGVQASRQWYWHQAFGSVRSLFIRQSVQRKGVAEQGDQFMRNVLRDLKYGFRILLRQPVFAITVILTMALCIGANTTVFSIVNTVLLRPLPFPEPDNLMALKSINPKSGGNGGGSSPADFYDWQARTKLFEHIAVETRGGGTLTGLERPQGLMGARVSEDFFATLRVNPLLGRTFIPSEFSRNSGAVIILSYGVWQRYFGRDPNIVGKTMELDKSPYIVVGVMPDNFKD